MALDGITTSAIVSELKAALLGGRIDKIDVYKRQTYRFLLSVWNFPIQALAKQNACLHFMPTQIRIRRHLLTAARLRCV